MEAEILAEEGKIAQRLKVLRSVLGGALAAEFLCVLMLLWFPC